MTDRPGDTAAPLDLQQFKMLREVGPEAVEGILGDAPRLHLVAGQQLLKSGQKNEHMYMVLSGQLRVVLDVDSDPIAQIGPGQTVGEISVIDQQPASAHVFADEPTELLQVDEDGFWRLVSASHGFSVQLILELADRLRANTQTVRENVHLRERFQRAALFDALTSIHNRRWLDDTLPRMLQRHQHSGDTMAVALIDVDHFKKFNDTYGHAAGDAVLITVAKALRTYIRPTDLVARFGGEEFVVLLPDTEREGALVVAERLRAMVAEARCNAPDGTELPPVTISVGVAMLADDNSASILARADKSLYEAKASGRDRVVCA